MSSENIISLSDARNRFDLKRCDHRQVIVDEAKAEVECEKCGEKLNPVWVLARFATEESVLKRRIDRMSELKKQLEEKQRTKCQHCQKMTRVRP